jgi:hypothetical protein
VRCAALIPAPCCLIPLPSSAFLHILYLHRSAFRILLPTILHIHTYLRTVFISCLLRRRLPLPAISPLPLLHLRNTIYFFM